MLPSVNYQKTEKLHKYSLIQIYQNFEQHLIFFIYLVTFVPNFHYRKRFDHIMKALRLVLSLLCHPKIDLSDVYDLSEVLDRLDLYSAKVILFNHFLSQCNPAYVVKSKKYTIFPTKSKISHKIWRSQMSQMNPEWRLNNIWNTYTNLWNFSNVQDCYM